VRADCSHICFRIWPAGLCHETGTSEQDIKTGYEQARWWEQQEVTKLHELEQHRLQQFDQAVENVRDDPGKAGNFDPLHAVAVILKNMKAMLEAIPRMAPW
jgi:hypothetical protein